MILSYKKQFPWGKPTKFEQKILDNIKIHSIRDDRHGRWGPGRKIHHANGVRTKNYNCFKESVCVSVQSIKIQYFEWAPNEVKVIIDEKYFYHQFGGVFCTGFDKMEQLARNDGFDSVEDFFKWFDTDFHGRIVHWTGFRY